MANPKFTEFMRELEAEAEAEGPAAVEELETFRAYYRLASELAKARKAKGLTQKQLAELAGLNQSEISDIERGAANPTLRTLHSVGRQIDYRVALIPARHAHAAKRVAPARSKKARSAASKARRPRRAK